VRRLDVGPCMGIAIERILLPPGGRVPTPPHPYDAQAGAPDRATCFKHLLSVHPVLQATGNRYGRWGETGCFDTITAPCSPAWARRLLPPRTQPCASPRWCAPSLRRYYEPRERELGQCIAPGGPHLC
jgi:hypothetical protein